MYRGFPAPRAQAVVGLKLLPGIGDQLSQKDVTELEEPYCCIDLSPILCTHPSRGVLQAQFTCTTKFTNTANTTVIGPSTVLLLILPYTYPQYGVYIILNIMQYIIHSMQNIMQYAVYNIIRRDVHNVDIKIDPPVKYPTPYGGRLEWTMPGGNKVIAHLKDKQKARHKKRWSQVRYTYTTKSTTMVRLLRCKFRCFLILK